MNLVFSYICSVAIILCCSSVGMGKVNSAFAYGDSIAIVAWAPCVDNDNPSADDFEGLRECGFNTALIHGDADMVDVACGYAESAGLRLIAGGTFLINPHKNEEFWKLKDRDVIHGWYLVDEPRYDRLKAYKRYNDSIRKITPDKLVYINLIGTLNPAVTGRCKSIPEYFDTIQSLFNPQIWSYDYYPVSLKDRVVRVDYERFYSDLEIFSKRSRDTGRPFWAFCQSMAFRNERVERPAATLPFLRFEAFSALAYGARGIVYWTYAQRVSKTEDFLSALVDTNGKRMPAWYAAKQVNEEIRLFNDIFINSSLVEYTHTGGILSNMAYTMDGNVRIKSDGAGFLISHLRTDGVNYLVVVNHDVVSTQRVRVDMDNGCGAVLLEPSLKNSVIEIKESKILTSYTDEISPGGYLIMKIKQ